MTISKAIRVNLNMNSYVRRHRNILTAHLKEITKERNAFLLNHLKNCEEVVHFFIDKKKFVVDEMANWRNSRVIALNPSEVGVSCRVKIQLPSWFLEALQVMVTSCPLILLMLA